MNRVLPIVLLVMVASFSLASLACSQSSSDTYSGTWEEIKDRRQFTISRDRSDQLALNGTLYGVSGCASGSRATLNGHGDLLIIEHDNLGNPRTALMVYEESTGYLKGPVCGGYGEWKKR
jgi:hypothetical protein